MITPMTIIGILLIIACIILLFVWKMIQGRKPSEKDVRHIRSLWKTMEQNIDDRMKIVEADSIINIALTRLGYTGTLGEKLKKMGKRCGNENDLWKAHKLRNVIAHEPNTVVKKSDVNTSLVAFKQALIDLGFFLLIIHSSLLTVNS